MAGIQARTIEVEGTPVRIHEGGSGPALLLLHGGWGGAGPHWSEVWETFADRHRVIAPELPAVPAGEGPRSFPEYTRWVIALLDTLGVDACDCVGNSLGAAIGRNLAGRAPARVRRLVLVNGGASFDEAPVVRALLAVPGGRRLVRWMLRTNTYSEKTVGRAFADPGRAPSEVVRITRAPTPALVELMVDLFVRGDRGAPPPPMPTLIVWGREDHLVGISVRDGEALAARLPRATLAVIERAGHLPQVEQPAQFVEVVEAFLTAA